MQPAYTIIRGLEEFTRLRRGPRYVRQDIQVPPLAPSVSRRVSPFAATVLRSGTKRRYRPRVPQAIRKWSAAR